MRTLFLLSALISLGDDAVAITLALFLWKIKFNILFDNLQIRLYVWREIKLSGYVIYVQNKSNDNIKTQDVKCCYFRFVIT